MSRPAGGEPEPDAPPPQGVEIRPARPTDARDALRLFAEVAAEERYIRTEDVRWTTRDMRRRYRRAWTRDAATIVAVAGGRMIGNLGVAREPHPVTRHVASLGMMVAPGWRSRGVGAAHQAALLRWARWAGVVNLARTVYTHNDRARRLYERFGFVEEGRLIGHSKKRHGYEDEIVMGRWL